MKIRLELAHKNAKIKRVVLKADTVIGRSAECGLRIASNEVSRQHCKICLSEEGVTVRDLGSSNGTFINGYQLEEQTDYEIAPDSELSVGGITFIVRFDGPKPHVTQADGLGSTVDLKPGAGEARTGQDRGSASEEAAPLASADEAQGSDADDPDESDESGQTTQDALELALVDDDDEVDLESLSESAILEREAKPSEPEPDPEPIFPGLEPEGEHDSSLGKFFQNFD